MKAFKAAFLPHRPHTQGWQKVYNAWCQQKSEVYRAPKGTSTLLKEESKRYFPLKCQLRIAAQALQVSPNITLSCY